MLTANDKKKIIEGFSRGERPTAMSRKYGIAYHLLFDFYSQLKNERKRAQSREFLRKLVKMR